MGRYHHLELGRAPGPSVIPIVNVKALLPAMAEAMSTARSVRAIPTIGLFNRPLFRAYILLYIVIYHRTKMY